MKPSADLGRSPAATAARVAAATFAGIVAGAVPGLVFWFAVRRADGSYPPNSEAIVLLAVPLVAGTAFAAVCPPRVWRKSVVFTGLFGVPLAVFTYLAIYRNDPSGLFSGPMLAVGAWILCWFMGALGAGNVSRLRTWSARGGTLAQWARRWWRRRHCHHDWELVETRKLMGRTGHLLQAGSVGYHNLNYYRCRNCGATKTKSDRWGPVTDRRS